MEKQQRIRRRQDQRCSFNIADKNATLYIVLSIYAASLSSWNPSSVEQILNVLLNLPAPKTLFTLPFLDKS